MTNDSNPERDFFLPYFEMVQNKEHWKNPINKSFQSHHVSTQIRENISKAIQFFTGTQATWKQSNSKLFWQVTADGYYLGPCN